MPHSGKPAEIVEGPQQRNAHLTMWAIRSREFLLGIMTILRNRKLRFFETGGNLLLKTLIFGLLAMVSFGSSLEAQNGREKKVFAHHMGSLNVGHGAMPWYTRQPELGDPTISTGGDYRNLAFSPFNLELSLEQSAELQIQRAIRVGIDGFAVNAWAGDKNAKEFLDALFKVAEEKDYPFEISICPDPNTLDLSNGFTTANVDAIKYLLDRHGDSPKLARRDGKPIIFGYQSNFIWVEYLWRKYEDQTLVDIARTTPEGWELIKDAFEQIEQLVGEPLYFQFDMGAFYAGIVERGVPQDGYYRAAKVVAKHLPALCDFLPSTRTADYARAAKEMGKEWGEPIYMNYDNNRMNWNHGGPGTDMLRANWQAARDNDSTLLQLTTWNDYHENTNISPGVNTRYSFFDLTGYFIDWWKQGSQPAPTHDRVYVFSRKYGADTQTFPFQSAMYIEGVIEVLTILPEPARIRVPGRGEYDAPAGLHYQQFPVTPGPVSAEVIRNGNVVLVVESPEPVTDKPFRQDNGIVGISSEFDRHWELDFGDVPPFLYSEYGDLDGDGLPNWFEIFWFGKPWDFSTATVANPNEDINNDGFTNLEAYQLQKTPVGTGGGLMERRPFDGSISTVPGRIEAEHFDEGGLSISYYDTTSSNLGGIFRPSENVDLEKTYDPAGSVYNIAWTEDGEWLEYTSNVTAPGEYDLQLRVASLSGGGRARLLVDGQDVTGSIEIPATDGWQNWQTVTVPVTLPYGEKVLRVVIESGGFNLNYFELIATAVNEPPVLSLASPLPGSTFDEGEFIQLAAQVADADGRVARIEFFSGDTKIGESVMAPYNFGWKNAPAGSHNIRARARSIEGGEIDSAPVAILVAESAGAGGGEPFNEQPAVLPGRVLAVEFDHGGEGVAYHDATSQNQGRQLRPEETVDIESTDDVGGGYNVGYIMPGEWLDYTVDVATAGVYQLDVRVSSQTNDRHFRVSFNEETEVRVDVPNTGGWQSWTTVSIPGVFLKKGVQTMRLSFDTGDFNLRYVELQGATAASPASDFVSWRQSHFSTADLNDPSVSGLEADPSGNGIPNLMSYALNRDPHAGDRKDLPQPGKVELEGQQYLTLTYTRPAGAQDVAYEVEVSGDMVNWQSGSRNLVPVSVISHGATEVVIVRDAIPLGNGANRFMRLRVRQLEVPTVL